MSLRRLPSLTACLLLATEKEGLANSQPARANLHTALKEGLTKETLAPPRAGAGPMWGCRVRIHGLGGGLRSRRFEGVSQGFRGRVRRIKMAFYVGSHQQSFLRNRCASPFDFEHFGEGSWSLRPLACAVRRFGEAPMRCPPGRKSKNFGVSESRRTGFQMDDS